MSEKYTEKDKKLIALLVKRLFERAQKCGYSYRQVAVAVKARSHVTTWRWFKGKSWPSQRHIYWIKKFLGYSRG